MQIETTEDLERIVDQQNRAIVALDERLKIAEARVQLQQRLIDAQGKLFIEHGWIKAQPIKKTPEVN